MKQYKRKKAFISTVILATVAVIAIIVCIILFYSIGYNKLFVISCEIAIVISVLLIFVALGTVGSYRYNNSTIDIMCSFFCYRKLSYTDYKYITISNASYNNVYSTVPSLNIPMQCKIKVGNKKLKRILPYISLHKSDYPIKAIKSCMDSRELFFLSPDEIYCLGICLFDSLKELLQHTNCQIYILEDVYLRFKDDLDSTIMGTPESMSNVFVVTKTFVTYAAYKSLELTADTEV